MEVSRINAPTFLMIRSDTSDERQWWAWVDLNHRPRPYQGRALAT